MKPTSTWRTIIELSSMNNNDEYVIHGDHEMKYEEVKELRFGMYGHPRLKLSRPVYDDAFRWWMHMAKIILHPSEVIYG